MWRTGEGFGEGNGDWEVECEEETTMGVGLADRECTERAWGEGASRLMTAGLMQPLELLASEVWLGPGVMVTGVSEPGLTSSSSSELSSVRSITSFFLPPGNSRAQSHTPASQGSSTSAPASENGSRAPPRCLFFQKNSQGHDTGSEKNEQNPAHAFLEWGCMGMRDPINENAT